MPVQPVHDQPRPAGEPNALARGVFADLFRPFRPALGAPLAWLRVNALVCARPAEASRMLMHGIRTSDYALLLGNAVGLSRSDLTDLHAAAILHDLGRLTLPPELLSEEGPLRDEEYVLVQSHPRAGADLLMPFPCLRVPAVWIAHHHERWDGCGYPYGLRGPAIPVGARILAIADAYDRLLGNLGCKTRNDWPTALRLIEIVAGSQFDPELVEVFVRVARRREAGTDRAIEALRGQ